MNIVPSKTIPNPAMQFFKDDHYIKSVFFPLCTIHSKIVIIFDIERNKESCRMIYHLACWICFDFWRLHKHACSTPTPSPHTPALFSFNILIYLPGESGVLNLGITFASFQSSGTTPQSINNWTIMVRSSVAFSLTVPSNLGCIYVRLDDCIFSAACLPSAFSF